MLTFNISTNYGGVQDKSTHWLINSLKPNNYRIRQLANSLTRQFTNSLTPSSLTHSRQFANSPTRQFTISQTRQFTNSLSPIHKLTNSLTRQLTNSQVYKLINSSTLQITSSSTQNLKSISFILQYHSRFCSVLAKIWVKKQVNIYYFYPSTSFVMSIFKNVTCILHHFAFLV